MPRLDWIGRKAVENHHNEVPFKLLRCDPKLSVGDPDSGNLLVEGDNLEALKALLPYYAGQVKCIYIDPPYNTGSENWVYNDNVNSPEIRKWLGKVVGREVEDLSRHDKWLCMMYPRLKLLHKFLRDDGAIFISIDDNEVHSLRFIMDEIFGQRNFLCSFAWEKRYAPPPDTKDFGYLHETILAYRKTVNFSRHLLPLTGDQVGRYKNPDNDPRGSWKAMDYTCRYTADERPNLYYPITNPNTGETIFPKKTRVWAISKEVHEQHVLEDRIWWGKKGTNKVPSLKNFLSDIQKGMMPTTLLKYETAGHTDEAAKELRALVPGVKFTPKPTRLIRHLLKIASDRDSIIMDSFAGSGTTGHAVLVQNKEDDGARKFILVEIESDICQLVTFKRLRNIIKGYKDIEQLGGGFKYCKLGSALFDADGQIQDGVNYKELSQHVFFIETGKPLLAGADYKPPLIGMSGNLAVYLLYNGALKDKSPNGGNALTRAVLATLPKYDGPKVIYGTSCRIGKDHLNWYGITFKQIPYEIKSI